MKTAKKVGYTRKQWAYARGLLGATEQSKKDIALSVGYPPSVANSTKSKIENLPGFSNAMAELAHETGNMTLGIYHLMKNKMHNPIEADKIGFGQLLEAVTVMSQAWERFTPKASASDNKLNPLKAILLEEVKSIDAKAIDNKKE